MALLLSGLPAHGLTHGCSSIPGGAQMYGQAHCVQQPHHDVADMMGDDSYRYLLTDLILGDEINSRL
jgi:hypothetical protein